MSRRRRSTPYRPPTAGLDALRRRAELLAEVRRFFAFRGVLEVETPVLAKGVIVEAHIDPMRCLYRPDGARSRSEDATPLYLQTSPEAAMKRLLVAGSGPIYQVARVFRDGECGRSHNPEFTMIEWYQPGFGLDAMIDEVGELAHVLLGRGPWEKRTYRQVFEDALRIDPNSIPAAELPRIAEREGIPIPMGLDELDRNGWLDLLLALRIAPNLGRERPLFVHGFPASQAALAQIAGDELPVAERFELFIDGVELANGYHELLDPREHRLRFEESNLRRTGRGRDALEPDADFLAALEEGLPDCSGVALGFDRVVMLALGAESIADVIAFAFDPGVDLISDQGGARNDDDGGRR